MVSVEMCEQSAPCVIIMRSTSPIIPCYSCVTVLLLCYCVTLVLLCYFRVIIMRPTSPIIILCYSCVTVLLCYYCITVLLCYSCVIIMRSTSPIIILHKGETTVPSVTATVSYSELCLTLNCALVVGLSSGLVVAPGLLCFRIFHFGQWLPQHPH